MLRVRTRDTGQDDPFVGRARHARLHPGAACRRQKRRVTVARGRDAGQGDELRKGNHHARGVLSGTHTA